MQSLSTGRSAAGTDSDPVAIEVNVDAALFLRDLAGIDSYPVVLALVAAPGDFRAPDPGRDRARALAVRELAESGILIDDQVHPVVANWLRRLYRPDTELAVRILDTGPGSDPSGMLRLSLVRSGNDHVLGIRCGDHVVIQPVFGEPGRLDLVSGALSAVLGSCPALRFEPLTLTEEQVADVHSDSGGRRRALRESGAAPHTATVLDRAMDEMTRRAEVVVIEHRDGAVAKPKLGVNVVDTASGRFIVTPQVAMDGQVRSTFAPGDGPALHRAVRDLVDLLPGRDWFGTSRSG